MQPASPSPVEAQVESTHHSIEVAEAFYLRWNFAELLPERIAKVVCWVCGDDENALSN